MGRDPREVGRYESSVFRLHPFDHDLFLIKIFTIFILKESNGIII